MLKPRFSHYRHSGYLLHRHHTSYAGLIFLVMVTAAVLLSFTFSAEAALGDPAVNPQAGSVAVSGKMAGPPPKEGATILQPTNGQRFGTLPVTVSGTCPKGLIVEIYKNNIFAGSTVCEDAGNFSLLIDLVDGQNILIARVFDALNQAGPDSNSVTVFYDRPVPVGSVAGAVTQLVLNSDTKWKGVNPGVEIGWPVEVIGGTAPYAISWDWGDAVITPISRPSAGYFDANHTYAKPGNYKSIVRASDVRGQRAYLQVMTIVHGEISPSITQPFGGVLAIAWPLLIMAVLIIISFYLGEKYEKKKLRGSLA
jgi:hypothetical protein